MAQQELCRKPTFKDQQLEPQYPARRNSAVSWEQQVSRSKSPISAHYRTLVFFGTLARCGGIEQTISKFLLLAEIQLSDFRHGKTAEYEERSSGGR